MLCLIRTCSSAAPQTACVSTVTHPLPRGTQAHSGTNTNITQTEPSGTLRSLRGESCVSLVGKGLCRRCGVLSLLWTPKGPLASHGSQRDCHSACNIDPLSRGIGVQN